MAAIAIPLLIGTAVTTKAVQAGETRKAARQLADQQEQDQKKHEKELENRIAAEESEENAIATRDAARQRQRQQARGAQGRRSTILTSPLGITQDYQRAGKTLLGQ